MRTISSPARKESLNKELIQAEVKLQKLYKQSNAYHEKKAVEAIKENVKYFYSYAKKKSKVKTKVGPLINKKTDKITTDSIEMADLLADQYDSVFSSPSSPPPTIEDSTLPINKITIEESEII